MVLRTFPRAGRRAARLLRLLVAVGLLAAQPALAGPASHEAATKAPPTALPGRLDNSDRLAALHALQMALNQVGDGGTFVWKKDDRGLMGIIKPTAAFRNANGQVCRHVIYAIALNGYRRQIELVACREAGGRWRL